MDWRGAKRVLRSKRWKRFRHAILMRTPFCATCGAVANELHHLQTMIDAPDRIFDLANVTPLCRDCHLAAHAKERGWTERREFRNFATAMLNGGNAERPKGP